MPPTPILLLMIPGEFIDNLGTGIGSIGNNVSGSHYSYKCSAQDKKSGDLFVDYYLVSTGYGHGTRAAMAIYTKGKEVVFRSDKMKHEDSAYNYWETKVAMRAKDNPVFYFHPFWPWDNNFTVKGVASLQLGSGKNKQVVSFDCVHPFDTVDNVKADAQKRNANILANATAAQKKAKK